jgi:hypothetical protein
MSQQKTKLINVPRYRRSPDFTTFYINHMNIAFTNVDFQMICGRTNATMLSEDAAIEEQTVITFTPAHAKLIHKALEKSIMAFEAQHGVIPEIKNEG